MGSAGLCFSISVRRMTNCPTQPLIRRCTAPLKLSANGPPTIYSRIMADPKTKAELRAAAQSLGLSAYRRHIFLCADQTEPKCAPRAQTAASWEFLKQRLKDLQLAGPKPLVYRSKVNCLRICMHGPIAVVYPEGVWYHSC